MTDYQPQYDYDYPNQQWYSGYHNWITKNMDKNWCWSSLSLNWNLN